MSLEEMNLHDVEDYSSEVTHDQLPSVEEARSRQYTISGKGHGRRSYAIWAGVTGIFIVLVTLLVIPFDENRSEPSLNLADNEFNGPAAAQTNAPVPSPTLDPEAVSVEKLEERLIRIALNKAADFVDSSTYQYRSLELILDDPTVYDYEGVKLQQRYAMYCLYHATRPFQWKDSTGWKRKGIDECDWYGVTCNEDGEVTRINLRANGLKGTLPDEVSLITKLESFNVKANELEGEIDGPICALQDANTIDIKADCSDTLTCSCCSDCP